MIIITKTPEVHDMTDTIEVVSTSSVTANASPIVLNQTGPTLVDNVREPHKSVSGELLCEKKRKNDDLFPSDIAETSGKVSRGSVNVGN